MAGIDSDGRPVGKRQRVSPVAARLEVDDATVSEARVAANGVIPNGVRLGPVEAALEGEPVDTDTITAAAARATEGLSESATIDTADASASYRAKLLEPYTRRALERAGNRAGVSGHF